MGLGIIAGVLTAVLQALSYIFSTAFMNKHQSSLKLVVFSQLVMGAFCLPFVCWLYPPGLEGREGEFILWIGIWAVVFGIGQAAFFNMLKTIEPSRSSSLLGLKIIVLSIISVCILRQALNPLQWLAVLMSTAAAVGMNWSGDSKFTVKGILWLVATLVLYSLADISETRLVKMPETCSMIRSAIGMGVVCYAVLGVLTLPMLLKLRWSTRQFVDSMPFAAAWFVSQITLFICFGILGTVFGNVIQASRGLISIALAIALSFMGLGRLDSQISRAMWIRRIASAVLMTAGIVLYSLAS